MISSVLTMMLCIGSVNVPPSYEGKIEYIVSHEIVKVEISGQLYTVKLQGISCPDNRTFKRLSKTRLKSILSPGRRVDVYVDTSVSLPNHMIYATIWADGININKHLVETGYAISWPIGLWDPDYGIEEETARSRRDGIWGMFK